MREEDLRRVLLVKAVEESDRDGAAIPPADRAAASREAMRNAPGADETRLIVERSRLLFDRVVARHPFAKNVMSLLGPPRALALGLATAGFVLGISLSALDGSHRINVLAFPLLGIVAWNFLVYAVLALSMLGSKRDRPAPVRAWLASAGGTLAARLIRRSRKFNAPLAQALEAFSREWLESAKPLLLARAASAFHLAAAAVGVGLIAGLYMRGIVFDYRAGWESTFLDAARAHTILAGLYGPGSWITGIPVPDAAQLEAMRWQGAAGGEPAARWIHLMAASALVYVVLPRVVLALVAALGVVRLSRNASIPASLTPYFRRAFAEVEGAVAPARALILPYAHEPAPGALARLIAWVPQAAGGKTTVDARASVPYGEEERHLAALREHAGAADIVVMPFSLATTPEDENHGTVISGARDWLAASRPRAKLLVVVDEAPYAERMGGSPERIAERREAWRRFVEARGLKPFFVSLAP